MSPAPLHGRRPIIFHAAVLLPLTLGLTFVLWYGASGSWRWMPWAGAWLAAVNVMALCYYGYDKWQARREGQRVPEIVLHGLAVAGGSLGAFLGMRLFRHKTLKGRFRLIFWLIVIAQLVLGLWLIRAK